MKTIYKYPIGITDYQELKTFVGAKLLTVQMQSGSPMIWAVVNTELPRESVTIKIYGTGNPIERLDDALDTYLGTFQISGLVFHVFYEPKPF